MDLLKETPHIIGYIDMLGIKASLKAQADVYIRKLNVIYEIIKNNIDNIKNDEDFHKPEFKYKFFSDNIIVAMEIGDEKDIKLKCWTMIMLLEMFQHEILTKGGICLRGAICKGGLYINDTFALGKGLVKAYFLESEIAIYPRIIVERDIAELFLDEEYPDGIPRLLTGDDDYAFVNYLCFANKDSINQHYDFIEKTCKKEKSNFKVTQKLSWLKRYHNNYCKASKIGKLFEDIYDDRFLF